MKEQNLTICKHCNAIKMRILDGKFNDKDKRYVNENGKQWMGKTCPECHLVKMRERSKAKRKPTV